MRAKNSWGEVTCAGDGSCGGRGGCREVRAGWRCSGKAARSTDRSLDPRPTGKSLPPGPRAPARPPPPRKAVPDPALAALFPPGFDPFAVAAKFGVTLRLLEKRDRLDRAPGFFDPDKNEVVLNPLLASDEKMRAGVAQRARFRSGLNIPEELAGLWAFAHEVGHALRKRRLPSRGNGALGRPLHWSERVEIAAEDDAADRIAERVYLNWRRGRPLDEELGL